MTSPASTLSNKVIYLISSEYWGIMHVSKHHYALELAKRGNTVYYIEPPSLSNKGVSIQKNERVENLFIVSYKPVTRGKRFLPKYIYRLLIKWQVRLLKQAIGRRPDVVWSFDGFRFENLSFFRAGISIFHAVDFFTYDQLPEEAKTADLCLCSSPGIKQVVEKGGRPTYFINHGLNEKFCHLAAAELNNANNRMPGKQIQVGYIGNLLMEALDRKMMQQVIENNPGMQFHFWGQVEMGKGGLVGFDAPEVFEFIRFLKNAANVKLYGPVPIFELYDRLTEMDMFWICWDLHKNKMWNENTNPHKILEYLSTGKPLVAHYMTTCKDLNLVDMLPDTANDNYLILFNSVAERVRKGEPIQSRKQRIEFALQNSYQKQIERIEALMANAG